MESNTNNSSINSKTDANQTIPSIVKHEEWIAARRELLRAEKELSRQKAALAQKRQALPWESVPNYEFRDHQGQVRSLVDLCNVHGNHTLVVWHFMYQGGSENGCHLCSFFLDGLQGISAHLQPRANICAIAHGGTPAELEAIRTKKKWEFPVLAPLETSSSFGRDLGVAWSPDEVQRGESRYNFDTQKWLYGTMAPGLSVFCTRPQQDDPQDQRVYHTYSTYSAGLADLNSTFAILDLIPEGRNEQDQGNMWWVKHKEHYTS